MSDIVVGEGRQIVFVEPDVALGLDLTASAVIALPVFLASSTYDSLEYEGCVLNSWAWATWSRSRPRVTSVTSSTSQLAALATEIRDALVPTCSRTGGHLGPNLGVVELTMAIHRVFDSPRDRVVFDTGHQAYVHKMLTGRAGGFDKLRQEGGLSGYPSQAESEHDIVENSHASTALSLRRRAGQGLRHPRRGPARRRGDRRRRADRRHGLGGAQQHRDRARTAGWSSSSTTTAAPTRRPSAGSPPP